MSEPIPGNVSYTEQPIQGSVSYTDQTNRQFFRECINGEIFDKFKGLEHYKIDNVDTFVQVISDELNKLIANNNPIPISNFTTTTKLNDILDPKIHTLTNKNNPFLNRHILYYDKKEESKPKEESITTQKTVGGNVMSDLLKPYSRTRNQIIRLYKSEIRKRIYRNLVYNGTKIFEKCAYIQADYFEKADIDATIEDVEKIHESSLKNMTTTLKNFFIRNPGLLKDDQVKNTFTQMMRNYYEGTDSFCYKMVTSQFSKTGQSKGMTVGRAIKKIDSLLEFAKSATLGPVFMVINKGLNYIQGKELTRIFGIISDKSSIEALQNALQTDQHTELSKLNNFFRRIHMIEVSYYNLTCALASISINGNVKGTIGLGKTIVNTGRYAFGYKGGKTNRKNSMKLRKKMKTRKMRMGGMSPASYAATSGASVWIVIILMLISFSISAQ